VTPHLPSTVGEQRTLYAINKRLINNWRNGNFIQFGAMTAESNWRNGNFIQFGAMTAESNCFGSVGKGQFLYGDNYLFVSRYNTQKGAVDVGNVGNVPQLYTSVPVRNTDSFSIFIVGSKLVIAKCIKVYVYKITLPEKNFLSCSHFLLMEILYLLKMGRMRVTVIVNTNVKSRRNLGVADTDVGIGHMPLSINTLSLISVTSTSHMWKCGTFLSEQK